MIPSDGTLVELTDEVRKIIEEAVGSQSNIKNLERVYGTPAGDYFAVFGGDGHATIKIAKLTWNNISQRLFPAVQE